MLQRNTELRRLLGGFCLLVVSLSASLQAVAGPAPAELYQAHRESIRRSGLEAWGGVLFAVGQSRPISRSNEAEHAAKEKATLAASVRLLDWPTNQTRWPTHLRPAVINSLWGSYRRITPQRAEVQGLFVIDTRTVAGGEVQVVVALPEYERQIFPVAYPRIEMALRSAIEQSDPRLNMAACLEICSTNRLSFVVELFARKLGEEVGTGASSTAAGMDLASIGPLLRRLKVGPDSQAGSSPSQLLLLLNAHPYHPSLCFQLGRALERDGFDQAAALFFTRGSEIWPEHEVAQQCRRAIKHTLFVRSREVVPIKYHAAILENARKQSDMLGPAGMAVVSSFGQLPARDAGVTNEFLRKASSAFFNSPPDLGYALTNSLRSLEIDLTADGANLAGRCLMLLNQTLLAPPFFAQAQRCDPNHPYAKQNYLNSLEALRSPKNSQ